MPISSFPLSFIVVVPSRVWHGGQRIVTTRPCGISLRDHDGALGEYAARGRRSADVHAKRERPKVCRSLAACVARTPCCPARWDRQSCCAHVCACACAAVTWPRLWNVVPYKRTLGGDP